MNLGSNIFCICVIVSYYPGLGGQNLPLPPIHIPHCPYIGVSVIGGHSRPYSVNSPQTTQEDYRDSTSAFVLNLVQPLPVLAKTRS